MMEFKPQNTAIVRKKMSAPLKFLLKRHYFISKRYHSILDYGCGRGTDVIRLKAQGYRVKGWDPHWENNCRLEPDEQFDLVICLYVLNVISSPEERESVISKCWQHVAPGGVLFVATRTDLEINSEAKRCGWAQYGDGYISSPDRRTFQLGFSASDITALIPDSCHYFTEVCERTKEFTYFLVSKPSQK